MTDLCACQREGIEAAAAAECSMCADGYTNVRLHNGVRWHFNRQGNPARLCAAHKIRALLTTPGQPCPRCEVVAAAEAAVNAGCEEFETAWDRLCEAIERMRS